MSDMDLRKKARRRALRAAQVVTLGLAMAGPGCADSHQIGDAPERDGGPVRVDADTPRPLDFGLADLGHDLGRDLGRDAGQDMGACPTDPWAAPIETRECCEAVGGWWDDATGECAVAVPGPFVPPPMNA